MNDFEIIQKNNFLNGSSDGEVPNRKVFINFQMSYEQNVQLTNLQKLTKRSKQSLLREIFDIGIKNFNKR